MSPFEENTIPKAVIVRELISVTMIFSIEGTNLVKEDMTNEACVYDYGIQ